LSQLPAIAVPNWRIGHQVRKIPVNYKDAIIDNNIHLKDKALNTLYQDIKLISRKSLFDKQRLYAIYNLNTKDYKINKSLYNDPKIQLPLFDQIILKNKFNYCLKEHPSKIISENYISKVVREGVLWNAKPAVIIDKKGLVIVLNKKTTMKSIHIGVDNNDTYLMVGYSGLDRMFIKLIPKVKGGGIRTRKINLDTEIIIDSLNIIPIDGDNHYSIGYFQYE
jgi:hypothetical protein